MNTLNAMWLEAVARFGEQPLIAYRESRAIKSSDGRIDEEVVYHPVTYGEVERLVTSFGLGLLHLGLQEEEPVAIIAENSLRWLVADLAILANRAFDVPRGCGASTPELAYLLKHARIRFALVEDKAQLDRILALGHELPALRTLIVIDRDYQAAASSGPSEIHSFDAVLAQGEILEKQREGGGEFARRRQATTGADIASLLYTSGTSGVPKGIPLTHANIMHNVTHLSELIKIRSRDRFVSLLPIWHTFERTVEYCGVANGAAIYYSTPSTLIKDLTLVSPHFLAGVPRLWMAIYNTARTNIRLAGKEKFFQRLYARSLQVIRARRYRQRRQYLLGEEKPQPILASPLDHLYHRLADLLIYRKIRGKFGRPFRAVISGGSSLPEYIDDFFEVIGLILLEGYGLTETSPVISVRTWDRRIPYTCGRPLPDTSVEIRDEEGKPLPPGSKGIVWVHGPQVMSGYYLNPDETARVMQGDKTGKCWFNTGDLGVLTAGGDLNIVGRAKDTIVLIGGENVEPDPLERLLTASGHIEQVMLVGQDQEYLAALVVPEKKFLRDLCRSAGVSFEEERIPELAAPGTIQQFYADLIDKALSPAAGCREVDKVARFAFTRPFTFQDRTLTHTMKIRRHEVLTRDDFLIRSLYPRYIEKGAKKESAAGGIPPSKTAKSEKHG